MKKIEEQNRLPLTFKYIEFIDRKKSLFEKSKIFFIKCERYQTDFYIKDRPVKPLVRLL
jgi:hypothetical protein